MSTTTDMQTAMEYCMSEHAVLLRLRTKNFMGRGADISFLSAFPAEKEILFPPLTYLQVLNQTPVVFREGGFSFTIVDLEPSK